MKSMPMSKMGSALMALRKYNEQASQKGKARKFFKNPEDKKAMTFEDYLAKTVREVLRDELADFLESWKQSQEANKARKVNKYDAAEYTGRPFSYFEKIGARCHRAGIAVRGPDKMNYFPVEFLNLLVRHHYCLEKAVADFKAKNRDDFS